MKNKPTIYCSLKPVKRSGIKRSVGKVITHTSLGHQERPYFKLYWMAAAQGMSNSDRSRWKLTEQTMIRVRINLMQHTQCINMTSMTQRQESLIRAKSGCGAREAEDDFQP